MRTKSVKKILINMMMLAVTLLTFVTAKEIVVKAADAGYDFNFYLNQEIHYGSDTTIYEYKETSSSVTLQCTWAEYSGSSFEAWACDYMGWYAGPGQIVYEGTWVAITNYIHENGSYTARVSAMLNDDTSGGNGCHFSGYWHADSDIY